MSIAILTPSRHRPEKLQELIDAIRQTATGTVCLYVGLDDDDDTGYLDDYGPDVQVTVAQQHACFRVYDRALN